MWVGYCLRRVTTPLFHSCWSIISLWFFTWFSVLGSDHHLSPFSSGHILSLLPSKMSCESPPKYNKDRHAERQHSIDWVRRTMGLSGESVPNVIVITNHRMSGLGHITSPIWLSTSPRGNEREKEWEEMVLKSQHVVGTSWMMGKKRRKLCNSWLLWDDESNGHN